MLSEAPNPAPARAAGGFQKPPLRFRKAEAAPAADGSAILRGTPVLRRLVWLYFILLLAEGALRKWVLPQYSAPLLVVRDPVAILIYLLAHQQKIVPQHRLFGFFAFQAVAGLLLVISQYVVLGLQPFVLFYGYRTAFLHLPLIFVLPHIFGRADVVRLGKFVVVCAIPMAVLMAYQFNSPPDAWINKTVGLSGTPQILAAAGKVRPPGTFSFISGPVSFFALVTAFLGHGLLSSQRQFPRALLLAGAVSVGLAVTVSGSRAAILAGAIVVVVWIFGALAGRGLSNRLAPSLLIVVLAVFVLSEIEAFHEGKEAMAERLEVSAQFEQSQGGLLGRYFREIITPLRMLPSIPFFGAGLGVGTNVGANALTGQMQFLVSEGEWGRNLLEMGPLFGVLFLWLRVALVWDLGRRSFDAAKAGDLLPLLLFSACAVNLFNGQIAQPTILGFTMLVAAFCAVCLRDRPVNAPEPLPSNLPRRFSPRAPHAR